MDMETDTGLEVEKEVRKAGIEKQIQEFITYLETIKKTSENTKVSYQRDLYKMQKFFERYQIKDMAAVTITSLNAYVLYLEKENFAASTISRNIASIKSFYQYLWEHKAVKEDISQQLKAPRVQRQAPEILTIQQVNALLSQPKDSTCKGIRDRAMLEIMYATGIRISELIELKVSDVNLTLGYIQCSKRQEQQFVPLEKNVSKAVDIYLNQAREHMVKDTDNDSLFVNCSGGKLSRQGIWKMLKLYGKKANIDIEITPHILRYSYPYHDMLSKNL